MLPIPLQLCARLQLHRLFFPALQEDALRGFNLAIALHFCFALGAISFARLALADAGSVPKVYLLQP